MLKALTMSHWGKDSVQKTSWTLRMCRTSEKAGKGCGGKRFGCFKVCSKVLWAEWDQPHIPHGVSHCLEPIYFVFI